MEVGVIVGMLAIAGTFGLMIAAIVITDRCNTNRRRADRLEGYMRDVLIETMSGEEHEARLLRMQMQDEYDRSRAAIFDGGF